MSREVRDRVWAGARCSGSKLVLLLALAERADAQGICWPGLAELGAKCRLEKRAVQGLLKGAVERGEIVVQRRVGKSPTGKAPTRYLVAVGQSGAALARVLIERWEWEEDAAREMAREVLRRQGIEAQEDAASTDESQQGDREVMSQEPKDAKACAPLAGELVQKFAPRGEELCALPPIEPTLNRQSPSVMPLSVEPILEAITSICGRAPDPHSPRDCLELEKLLAFLGDWDADAAAQRMRERFARWDKATPPHLSQIVKEWGRMERLGRRQTPRHRSAREQLAQERRELLKAQGIEF